MSDSFFHITGVAPGTGTLPVRLEFNDFIKNADLLNLYLLGLDRMQKVSQDDPLSYYQIAGIHGLPYTEWDHVGDDNDQKSSGYCSHSSILFATWHRPYLALYEQSLYANIQAVVKQYPAGSRRDRYAKAASTFRMPYWDWAASLDIPDLVALKETVTVDPPSGPTTINNPLFSYHFQHTPTELQSPPYSFWPQTLRHPTSLSSRNAKSQPTVLKRFFENQATKANINSTDPKAHLNLRDRILALLSPGTQYEQYQAFSNEAWIPNDSPADYDSLEGVHNVIHTIVGWGGHMAYPDWAAFDPIFWLHHTNIDRIFALWQALHPNPNSWVLNQESSGNNFWSPPGQIEDADTPLVPFHKSDTDYFTSNDIKPWTVFGCTYPELTETGLSTEQLQASVQASVVSLYGSTTPAMRIMRAAKAPSTATINTMSIQTMSAPPVQLPKAAPAQAPLKHAVGPTPTPAAVTKEISEASFTSEVPIDHPKVGTVSNGKEYTEWICNIRTSKYQLNGSFVVYVFLGPFTDDPLGRASDPNLVGTAAIFANDVATTGCQRCLDNNDKKLTVTGAVPLTGALLDRIADVKSLEPSDVIPYLKKNLHWRVHKVDQEHTNVPRAEVPDLKVGVTSCVVQLPATPHSLPVYERYTPVSEITKDTISGITEDDTL
jgi:tyrosinase